MITLDVRMQQNLKGLCDIAVWRPAIIILVRIKSNMYSCIYMVKLSLWLCVVLRVSIYFTLIRLLLASLVDNDKCFDKNQIYTQTFYLPFQRFLIIFDFKKIAWKKI